MRTLKRKELKGVNGGTGTLTGIALGIVTDIAIDYCKDVTRNPDKYREKRSSYCSTSLATGQSL